MSNYKSITVQDIVNYVKSDPVHFTRGLNTEVTSGDFEGNYTHQLHELQYDGMKVCLAYEMHEGQN